MPILLTLRTSAPLVHYNVAPMRIMIRIKKVESYPLPSDEPKLTFGGGNHKLNTEFIFPRGQRGNRAK